MIDPLKYLYIFFIGSFFGLLFQQPYSKLWDKKLKGLLKGVENGTVEFVPIFNSDTKVLTCYIGETLIWTINYPYSFGHLYSYSSDVPKHRPSYTAMIKLKGLVDKAVKDKQKTIEEKFYADK